MDNPVCTVERTNTKPSRIIIALYGTVDLSDAGCFTVVHEVFTAGCIDGAIIVTLRNNINAILMAGIKKYMVLFNPPSRVTRNTMKIEPRAAPRLPPTEKVPILRPLEALLLTRFAERLACGWNAAIPIPLKIITAKSVMYEFINPAAAVPTPDKATLNGMSHGMVILSLI